MVRRFSNNGTSSIFNNIKWFNSIADYMILILFLATIISGFLLKKSIKNTDCSVNSLIMEIENVTATHFLNYISIYLLSCIGLSINNLEDIFVFVFTMILIGYIYVTNNMFYINPTLNFFGYKIYNAKIKFCNTDEITKTIIVANKNVKVKPKEIIKTSRKSDFVLIK